MSCENSSNNNPNYAANRKKLYEFVMVLNGEKKQLLLRTSQLEDQLKKNEDTLKCTNDELGTLHGKLQQSLEDKQSCMLKLKDSEVSAEKLKEENLECKTKLENLSSELKKTEDTLKLAIDQCTALQQIQDLLNNCQSALSVANAENAISKERIALLTSELENEKRRKTQASRNLAKSPVKQTADSASSPIPQSRNQESSSAVVSSPSQFLPSLGFPASFISPLPESPLQQPLQQLQQHQYPKFTWRSADNSFVLAFPRLSTDQEATIICGQDDAKVIYKIPDKFGAGRNNHVNHDLNRACSAQECDFLVPDRPVPFPDHARKDPSSVRKRLHDIFDSGNVTTSSHNSDCMPSRKKLDTVPHILVTTEENDDDDDEQEILYSPLQSPSPQLIEVDENCDNLNENSCEVVEILENLDLLRSSTVSINEFAEKLANALNTAVNQQCGINAIVYTVNFLGSQSVNPIVDSIDGSDVDFIPVEELCIVKSYGLLSDSSYVNKLADQIYITVMNADPLKFSCLAPCRVFTMIQKKAGDDQRVKHFCYDLLKKHVIMGPTFIASVLSVWTDVLEQELADGSAVYVKNVISYLLHHNPGVEDSIWLACVNFVQTSCHFVCPEMEPIGILNSMIETLELTSTEECFSKKEEFNYSLALTLLCTRFDQSWIIKNVVKQKLFAVIERFLANNNAKMCGVVVLCYKFLRDLATDDNIQIICVDFVKKALTSITKNTGQAPVDVIMESYHLYYVLYKEHHKKVDRSSSRWLQRHGFNFEKMCFEK